MEEKYGVKRMLKRRNKKPGKRKKILTPIAAMKKEVRAYGFSFSLRAYFKQLFAVCVGVLLIGIGYSLRTPFLLSLAVMVTLMLPKLILVQFRYVYEQQRFENAVLYMEQMIYSMQKLPKIREAIADAASISDPAMQHLLQQVLERIDQGQDVAIYEVAFTMIEEQYGCQKMESLHRFFLQLEVQGSQAENYLQILHEDLKRWVIRVYDFQKDVKKIKRNVLLSVAVALLSSSLMTRLVPAQYSFTGSWFYQCFITGALAATFFFYRLIHTKLHVCWLTVQKKLSREEAEHLYERAVFYDLGKEQKKAFCLMLCFAGISALLWFLFRQVFVGLVFGVSAVYMFVLPQRRKRQCQRRAEREIAQAYPDWLRDIAIHLQFETVQSSIFSSYPQAGEILKPEIRKLMQMFEQYPNGVEPYNCFLDSFSLPEIRSSFRMLYAIQNLGKEETQAQLSTLMERNMELADKAEILKNEDRLGAAMFLIHVPSMIGMSIIVVCIVLLLTSFSSIMNQATSGLAEQNIIQMREE